MNQRECESAVISLIAQSGVKCMATVPEMRPDEFVTVERTGTSDSEWPSVVVVLEVSCWDTTTAKAADLADTVSEKLADAPLSIGGIYKVEETARERYADPDSGQARYVSTYEMTIM